MNIIGLGNAGCQIANNFKNYEQYKVFCVDTENKGYDTFLPVKYQNSHEDYEKNYKKLSLSKCKGDTTLIMCGSGNISGCALRLLEQIKSEPTTVLFIKPDISQMSNEEKLKCNVTFNILQNYARSALLKKMYVVSNNLVEEIVENISIKDYWKDINNVISSTYNMINVFENNEPLLTSVSKEPETARISTFGVVNYETGSEKLFYDLKFARTKNYFYGINEKTLEEDKNILHKIRSFVKEASSDKNDAGFAIYSTTYEHDYVYTVQHASFIQEQKVE
tara:strand:+ start:4222 stop:5055 length:834 start_codon:yes stop_codon:yes gene_type:complete